MSDIDPKERIRNLLLRAQYFVEHEPENAQLVIDCVNAAESKEQFTEAMRLQMSDIEIKNDYEEEYYANLAALTIVLYMNKWPPTTPATSSK